MTEWRLKRIALWGGATAFMAGVIAESIATCLVTDVCSYPRTALTDAMLLGLGVFATRQHVLAFMREPISNR